MVKVVNRLCISVK